MICQKDMIKTTKIRPSFDNRNHKVQSNIYLYNYSVHLWSNKWSSLLCVPWKGFRSAVDLKRDRWIVYIVSQSADPNLFLGTAGSRKFTFHIIFYRKHISPVFPLVLHLWAYKHPLGHPRPWKGVTLLVG